MLYSDYVSVKVNSNHLKYYKDLGYSANMLETLEIQALHLPKGSHVKVDMQCDTCKSIVNVEFRAIKDKTDFLYSCKSCAAKQRIKINGTCFSDPNLQRELGLRNNENSFKKRRETKLNKYGDETYNNQLKRKETTKVNHGAEHFNNPAKRKETLKINHGDENFNNQSKKIETCLLKYGVEHTNHLPEVWDKILKTSLKTSTYKDTNLTYQGSYELDFLNFCFDNNIEVHNGPSIDYVFNGKKRKYHSDFIIPLINLVVEIKSTYTLNANFDCNIAKEEATKLAGYKFIFIVDMNYDMLLEMINPMPVTEIS
jgi:hypothetical protein